LRSRQLNLQKKKPPRFDIPSLKVIFMIPVKEPPTLKDPNKWSLEFNSFITRCLKKDAEERPSSKELLTDEFIEMGKKNTESLKLLIEKYQTTIETKISEKMASKNNNQSSLTGTGTNLTKGSTFTTNSKSGRFTSKSKYGTSSESGTTKIKTRDEEGSNTAKLNTTELTETEDQYGTTKMKNQ